LTSSKLRLKAKNQRCTLVDLSSKGNAELINLAIVKLKMEEDFLGFKINKFIVMLYDFDLISTLEYDQYIYGTTDEKKIELTKYGLSVSLISRLAKDGQLQNLYFDPYNNLTGTTEFYAFLETVNDFYRFEISRYLN
jgi:membrane-bound acyltransferase YfiQ involved in biofilm formation